MNARKVHQWNLLFLVMSACLTAIPVSSVAAQTLRTFAQLDSCVNWEAAGSKRIVAQHEKDSVTIEFVTPDYIDFFAGDVILRDEDGNFLFDLQSTMWQQVPVVHITDSDVTKIRSVYWLVEANSGPLPTGATSQTGPLGDVFSYVSFRTSRAGSGNGDNSGKYYINPNGNFRFCVSMGLFNK